GSQPGGNRAHPGLVSVLERAPGAADGTATPSERRRRDSTQVRARRGGLQSAGRKAGGSEVRRRARQRRFGTARAQVRRRARRRRLVPAPLNYFAASAARPWSSARLSSSTLTRGSPMRPSAGASTLASTTAR